MKFRAVYLSSLLVLTGCATTPADCDPANRSASLLTKMSCDSSGAYRQKVNDQEQQLQRNQELNALSHQILIDMESRKQHSNTTLAQEQADQQALKASLSQLVAQLKVKGGKQAGLQRQINALAKAEQQFTPSSNDNAAQVAAKREEAAQLEAKVKELNQSLGY
ncbi:lipoprotein [Aeromonas enteropelogenes]|uniref:Lipoprotein n=2 Tax=Aeromonas TaxID=642 RepID=A0AA42V8P2_AERCA|nr:MULTISPECIES: hypothetical protein [Aeromonas]MBL0522541.1 hypothetical protein [Aeromonas enteropelogenes]MDH1896257.1 hypothetical protein [Aeromonas caviae]UBH54104.1 hypothetical protein LA321_09965 [Aeromonas enteropelogenes]BEE16380.1 lipoprotein [Aeromonas enteropelogenes]BEE20542.1 lipoprotein [Aeromonas enteropelogenes]